MTAETYEEAQMEFLAIVHEIVEKHGTASDREMDEFDKRYHHAADEISRLSPHSNDA